MSDTEHLVSDPGNQFSSGAGACEPLVQIPSWWGGFLFHVLNTRQLAVYVYIAMSSDENGISFPTSREIQHDLGLLSDTAVFDAIRTLEQNGFLLRARRRIPGTNAERNVYQRTACEYTLLQLLERGLIDGSLRPIGRLAPFSVDGPSKEVEAGLRLLLGHSYAEYVQSAPAQRKPVLERLLRARLDQKRSDAGAASAPRDS